MSAGTRVRRRATGEEGVILAAGPGSFVQVAFTSGTSRVHINDVDLAAADPLTMLGDGLLGDSTAHVLGMKAAYLRHAYRYDLASGLSNARIEPEAHQVFAAHRVTSKLAPRMILADEVGLGKTIEAGLVLKELRARGLADRVLIVTPASLTRQWQQELHGKFNEEFQIFDGAALKYLGKDGRNPWGKSDSVICSLPFVANPKRAEQVVEVDWDIVIFDEAHRVRRSFKSAGEANVTQAYRLADDLKESVTGLLLLTATPMQLHPFELYSLIELVEPGLYKSFEHYQRESAELPRLNDLMRGLLGWETLTVSQQDELVEEHGSLLQKLDADPAELINAPSRRRAMNALTELHPLSEALVRNRKSQLDIVSDRKARRFLVPQNELEAELYLEISGYIQENYEQARAQRNLAVGFLMVTYQKMLTSSSHALRVSLRRRAKRLRDQLAAARAANTRLAKDSAEDVIDAEEQSESLELLEGGWLADVELRQEIEQLESLAARLDHVRDSKALELLKVLDLIRQQGPDEKVVIFTQFIETQNFLAYALKENGYSTALFNGKLNPEEKEEQIQHFREGAQVLISTEAGGEGRNLQFCHFLINYDLPWNPMKVEQRIGRLDRIGQRHPVTIYNLAYEHTVEERVLDVLEYRIDLFTQSVGALDPILGEIERDIERIVLGDAVRAKEELEQYGRGLEERVATARAKEDVLADFILDRASLRRDQANELLEHKPLASHRDLRTFVAGAMPYLGGTLTEHPDGGDVVSLSPRLAARMGARQSVVRGAFEPRTALAMEELDFFAFGHSLLDGLIDACIALDPGGLGAREADDVPAGLWIEFIYRITAGGVRPRGMLIRHLADENGVHSSAELSRLDFNSRPVDLKVPEWAPAAALTSEQLFDQELNGRRGRLLTEHEATREQELHRAARVYQFREFRLQSDISRAERWLNERAEGASQKDQRVMPARRGRLMKDRERLARIRAEYELEVERIRAQEMSIDGELVVVGMVRGTA